MAHADDWVDEPNVPAEVQVEYLVEVLDVIPVEDLTGDRSLLKTIIRRGKGAETPGDGAMVKVRVLGRGDDRAGVENKTLEFELGDGTGQHALPLPHCATVDL